MTRTPQGSEQYLVVFGELSNDQRLVCGTHFDAGTCAARQQSSRLHFALNIVRSLTEGSAKDPQLPTVSLVFRRLTLLAYLANISIQEFDSTVIDVDAGCVIP